MGLKCGITVKAAVATAGSVFALVVTANNLFRYNNYYYTKSLVIALGSNGAT